MASPDRIESSARSQGARGSGLAVSVARTAARRAALALPEAQQLKLRRYRNRKRPLPRMSIGLLTGDTPWTLGEASGQRNPVVSAADVTDADAAFVADPFAVERDGTWHLFFEVMSRNSGKGEIGYARSEELSDWTYQGLVLSERFHLSYPAVYQTDDVVWMIPETWESKQVRLYRADPFPSRWVLDRVLLDGVAGTDPTLFRTASGRWSMLLCQAESVHNSTLMRYDAPDICGPWVESAESPLVVDSPDQARPGGHCFAVDGEMHRLGQDCSRRYGERLRSFPLRPPWTSGGRDVLLPTGTDWRSRGGHHADIHAHPSGGWVAFVDGES